MIINVIAEGITEIEVGEILIKHNILNNQVEYKLNKKMRKRQGYDNVINIIKNPNFFKSFISFSW